MPCRGNFSLGIHVETRSLNTKIIHTLNHCINPVNTHMLAFPTSQLNLLIYFCLILLLLCLGGRVEQRML